MPSHLSTRPLTTQERERCQQLMRSIPAGRSEAIVAITNTVLMAALLLGAGLALLAVIRWLGRRARWTFAEELFSQPMLSAVCTAAVAYACWSSFKWYVKGVKGRANVRSAVQSGMATVETYDLVEAKCYQEQEHGGLMYLARTDDDKVVCLYDRESQDLGVQGEEPRDSTFRVKRRLEIVRLAEGGLPVSVELSGEHIAVAEPLRLALRPDNWPEADAAVDIRWHDADRIMTSRRRERPQLG